MKVRYLAVAMLLASSVAGCGPNPRNLAKRAIVAEAHDEMPDGESAREAWTTDYLPHGPDFRAFQELTARNWRNNYHLFSEALVEKASESGIDSASLSNVLRVILADANGGGTYGGTWSKAYLPVGAYFARSNTISCLLLHYYDGGGI